MANGNKTEPGYPEDGDYSLYESEEEKPMKIPRHNNPTDNDIPKSTDYSPHAKLYPTCWKEEQRPRGVTNVIKYYIG